MSRSAGEACTGGMYRCSTIVFSRSLIPLVLMKNSAAVLVRIGGGARELASCQPVPRI